MGELHAPYKAACGTEIETATTWVLPHSERHSRSGVRQKIWWRPVSRDGGWQQTTGRVGSTRSDAKLRLRYLIIILECLTLTKLKCIYILRVKIQAVSMTDDYSREKRQQNIKNYIYKSKTFN